MPATTGPGADEESPGLAAALFMKAVKSSPFCSCRAGGLLKLGRPSALGRYWRDWFGKLAVGTFQLSWKTFRPSKGSLSLGPSGGVNWLESDQTAEAAKSGKPGSGAVVVTGSGLGPRAAALLVREYWDGDPEADRGPVRDVPEAGADADAGAGAGAAEVGAEEAEWGLLDR
jgi:hypothetical protein